MKRRISDGGFSLTELLVVMILMGMVLSVAYGLFQITRTGTTLSNREAAISREVAVPLDFAERVLSQMNSFDNTHPGISKWRCAFRTQRAGAAGIQTYVIEVREDSGDHRLLVTMDHAGDGSAQPVAWSTANHNYAANEPLFKYLDYEGNEIDDVSATTLLDARAVVITIVTEHEGRRFRSSRTVFFRNR